MPPGERRTRISRGELAAAAVRIADTEGFDALSMRRLAQEVGVGTMTIYHHLRNKDELLTLVNDAVMGEVVVPDDERLPNKWRAALSIIANRSRASIARHPWVLDIGDPPIGPNGIRHFDQTMQAVASIDLPLADRIDIAATVDEFVFGFCLFDRNMPEATEGDDRGMIAYASMLLETGAYPTLAGLVDEVGAQRLWHTVRRTLTAPKRFQRHLDRLLDGIESQLAAG
jgi:AcrR family transcriptional regulator